MGAELGSMRVTEQIDAMEVSGTNPFKYLVVTRVAASTLMLPVLVVLGDAIALFGSFLGVNIRSSTSFALFFRQVLDNFAFRGRSAGLTSRRIFSDLQSGSSVVIRDIIPARAQRGRKAANSAVVIGFDPHLHHGSDRRTGRAICSD